MPEGDTLHRTAARLRPELLGRPLVEVYARERGSIGGMQGATVRSVEAVGKHLVVQVEGGWFARVHLGMKGSFRRYQPGVLAAAERQRAPLLLATDAEEFVCWGPSQVAFGCDDGVLQDQLARVGDDLMTTTIDDDALLSMLRQPATAERCIGEVLLDQRIAAGIGNVYKSELMFLCRVHPWSRVRQLSDAELLALYQLAQRLLQHNLHTPRRVTTRLADLCPSATRPLSRLWVYGRIGKPCWTCGTTLALGRQGDLARSTTWCPQCQPAADSAVHGHHLRQTHRHGQGARQPEET